MTDLKNIIWALPWYDNGKDSPDARLFTDWRSASDKAY